MSIDPDRYACDVVLHDGSTLRLRPVRPEDAPAICDLHRRLTPEGRYFRFFTDPLDEGRVGRLAAVDFRGSFGLVGEVSGRVVAAAHGFRKADAPDRAEVAFVTDPALQGRGIGTRLLERLAEAARDMGIAAFEAEVLGDNRRMLDVFLKSGFEVQRRLDGGVYHVVFQIAPTPRFEDAAANRAQAAASASMKAFFAPRAVAVVGAGRRRGGIGAEVFHNILTAGFQGVVYPVNRTAPVVGSVKAWPSIADIPGPVDLAVVVVPAAEVEAVVDACIAKGVRAMVVITAGFSETGADGRASEAALLAKVRAAGVRMVGPNCMGLINTDPEVALNATFSPVYPPAGRVAMSTQSGALGLAILDYARRLNIGISTFVSIGNKADVSGNDLVQYWAEDPRTDVILLYLESFGNPRNFGRIARRVARTKPIVAVKSGRSKSGARAASSHSGALASQDVAVDALFRQAGVIRTDTLQEMFDVASLLAHQPVPRGRRVAIVTNAGGPGILAADACEAHGMVLPTLADATVAELRSFLPATASVANPVDMIASATPEHYRRTIRAVLGDGAVDSLIVIYISVMTGDSAPVAKAIVDGTGESGAKPVLATFMQAEGAPESLGRIPCYAFPEAAAVALARATAYGEWRGRPVGTVPSLPDIKAPEARVVVEGALARGGGWLDPGEAQALLTAVGIRMARSRSVGLDADVAAVAAEIGFPVALKAVGPSILHKTEVGGVALGLADAAAVRAARDRMVNGIGAALTGFMVQQMVPAGVEVVVGATMDPVFGPLVVYGSGGVLVELLHDVAFRIHPLTDADVSGMLDEVRGTALLRGYRGAPPADEGALRETILRTSALLDVCPEVQEIDINPVKVLARGAVAVDARVRVALGQPQATTRRIAY